MTIAQTMAMGMAMVTYWLLLRSFERLMPGRMACGPSAASAKSLLFPKNARTGDRYARFPYPKAAERSAWLSLLESCHRR